MKLADVVFPGSYDEMAALSSAELRVLVGKLPGADALHPKLASMGYHMTKAERVAFIGQQFYGVAGGELADNALSNAEAKYAVHQSKKGTKTGKKIPGPANCAATVAKTLVTLADAVPGHVKFGADLDQWVGLAAKPGADDIAPWLQKLLKEPATDWDVDKLLDFDEALTGWQAVLKAEGNLGQQWDTAAAAVEQAKKLDTLAPKAAAEIIETATTAMSQTSIDALNEVGQSVFVKLGAGDVDTAVQALVDFSKLDLEALPKPTTLGLSNAAQKVPDLAQLSVDQLDELSEALPKIITKVLKKAPDDDAPQTLALVLQDVIPEVKKTKAALAAAEQAQEAALATAAQESAYEATKAVYAALTKADLKKLGPAVFDNAGIQPKSLAHYLTKDDLADALAKIDNGLPVDDLVEKAQLAKDIHKGKATAKVAPKSPDAPSVPSFQAADTTADTTVLTPAQATTKAKKAKPPVTEADVEQTIVPELGPAPDTLGVPQTKHPKPPQIQHSWSSKPKQANLGGAHTKHQYVDEDGNVWMWKKSQTESVARGEALAHDIGWDLGFDMADIRYADGWQVPGKGTFPHGTVQKFHQGVKGDMKAVPVHAMTPEQLAELQDHQVFDWLISQHDTHSENILVMADGHLAPIDKGQAFKFFGADKLEVGYIPQGNFGRPVYYDLWDEYAAGKLDLDLNSIDAILSRIELLDEAEYEAKIRAYVKRRRADGGPGMSFLPAKLQGSEDALVNAIMGRKREIREQFTEFYRAQAKRRGETWVPAWEKRVADAVPEVLDEVGPAVVATNVTTPITQALADDVAQLGTGGRSLHLAGKDVHQGQALVYVEQGTKGERILRMELRLAHHADDRLTDTLKGITGDLGTGNAASTTGGGGYVADDEWSNVLAFAKTVGAHGAGSSTPDGLYNATTVANALNLLDSIDSKVASATKKAAKALADNDIDEWAAGQAQIEKLGEYKKHLTAAKEAMDAGQPPPYKAAQFDVAKATQGWKAKAPEAPVTKTDEPVLDVFDKLTVGPEKMTKMAPTDDFLGWRRTGGEADVITRPHHAYGSGLQGPGSSGGEASTAGRMFQGVIDVDGVKVKVRFRSYQQTAASSQKGLLDVEIVDWDGTAGAIEKLTRVLGKLDIDAKLATAEDEALTYWRVLTGSWKHSVEYNQGTGSGPYGKIRKTIDAIEAKVAKAGDLSPAQEAAIYRDAWTEVFGAEAVGRAPERLVGQRNIFGNQMGYDHVRRFDLPEDMRSLWNGQQAGYVHGTKHLSGKSMTTLNGAATTDDLVRVGALDFNPGATSSATTDLYTGGSGGTFVTPGWSGYATGQDFVIARPAVADAKVGTYLFPGDRWGALGQRKSEVRLDLAASSMRKSVGSGEAAIRGGIDWGEDMEVVVVRTKTKRNEMLADLRSQGVTEIRGRPIEERILHAQTDGQAQALVKQITAERADSLFRPYDDIPELLGQQPTAPAPKKVAKAVKKKATPKAKPPTAADPPPLSTATTPSPPTPVTAASKIKPEDSGAISNAFADIVVNPYDADFPAELYEVKDYLIQQVAEGAGIPTAKASKLVVQIMDNAAFPKDFQPLTVVQAVQDLGAKYHGMSAAVDFQPSALAKVNFLTENIDAVDDATKLHLAETLGHKKWADVITAYTNDPGDYSTKGDLTVWMKNQAAGGAGDMGKLQTAELKVWEDAAPGDWVIDAEDSPAFMVKGSTFDHVKFKQVEVEAEPWVMENMTIAQGPDGKWYKLGKLTAGGEPTKVQLAKLMKAAGWPGL